jgi:hypothetical protein
VAWPALRAPHTCVFVMCIRGGHPLHACMSLLCEAHPPLMCQLLICNSLLCFTQPACMLLHPQGLGKSTQASHSWLNQGTTHQHIITPFSQGLAASHELHHPLLTLTTEAPASPPSGFPNRLAGLIPNGGSTE